jgi:hypothetical protein
MELLAQGQAQLLLQIVVDRRGWPEGVDRVAQNVKWHGPSTRDDLRSASVCASYMPPAVSDRPAGGKTYTAAFHFVAVEKSLEQAPRPFLRCHAYQQRCRLRVRNDNAPSLVRIAALARTRPASIEARNPGLLLEEGETDLRVAQAAIYAT